MSTHETDFPGGAENINNLIYKMAAKNGRGLILLIYKFTNGAVSPRRAAVDVQTVLI